MTMPDLNPQRSLESSITMGQLTHAIQGNMVITRESIVVNGRLADAILAAPILSHKLELDKKEEALKEEQRAKYLENVAKYVAEHPGTTVEQVMQQGLVERPAYAQAILDMLARVNSGSKTSFQKSHRR